MSVVEMNSEHLSNKLVEGQVIAPATSSVEEFHPYCTGFESSPIMAEWDVLVANRTTHATLLSEHPDLVAQLSKGEFPVTRFTSHVQQLVNEMNVSQMEAKCKWKFAFSVPQPFSRPVFIACQGKARQRMVPWWCTVFHRLFQLEESSQSNSFDRGVGFLPILPTNVTMAISNKDFIDFDSPTQQRTCLVSSAPQGSFSITNFLELQRMNDRTAYPILPWSQRCSTPIWRGSAWMPSAARFDANDPQSSILDQAVTHSTRVRAVWFSKQHPDLLDAKISDPNNGFLSWYNRPYRQLWEQNATNGLKQLLPFHGIPAEEYYSHYQVSLVLCGIGAAFRTSIHLSTATTVVLQSCAYEEWFTSYMTPWQHYIPLDENLVNLSEALEWIRDHPRQVEGIGARGRQFYLDYLSFDRNYEHFYELLYRLSLRQLAADQ